MKTVLKIFIFLIVIVNFFSANIFPQTNSSKSAKTNKSDIIVDDFNQVVDSGDNLPWASSFYVSGGYGSPQGLRFELGYNFGSDISLAATFGINDNWSRDPEEGTIGIIGKIHFLQIQSTKSYILLGYGGTISIYGGPDTYSIVHIGFKIPLINWLQLCPEFGFVFTSKHISGGSSLFGGSSPEVNETKTRLGFNISFEIDFRQIF